MTQCNWEVIDKFSSPSEYHRFCEWLDEQLKDRSVEEVPVRDSYAGPLFEEKWFRCKESGEVWRRIAPQDPFHGYWGPVA